MMFYIFINYHAKMFCCFEPSLDSSVLFSDTALLNSVKVYVAISEAIQIQHGQSFSFQCLLPTDILQLILFKRGRETQPGDVKVKSILNNQPDQSYLVTSIPSTIFRNYFARTPGGSKSKFFPGTGLH
jgi:hypothetical protein